MPGTQGGDVKSATRELVESLPDDAIDVAKSVKLPWASGLLIWCIASTSEIDGFGPTGRY